jgi:hypothetical protein
MRIEKNERGWLLEPETSTEEASLEPAVKELVRRFNTASTGDADRARRLRLWVQNQNGAASD